MGDGNVTVGLDIGTTSVKGLAVDDDGHVLERGVRSAVCAGPSVPSGCRRRQASDPTGA